MLLSERSSPPLTTESFTIDEHFKENTTAEYFMVVKTKDDQWVHYIFDLSFQTDNDCWMVDAVLLMPVRFQPNPKSVVFVDGFRSAVL
jgi:hypothetical protein